MKKLDMIEMEIKLTESQAERIMNDIQRTLDSDEVVWRFEAGFDEEQAEIMLENLRQQMDGRE